MPRCLARISRSSKFGVASLEYIGNVVTPETEGIQPMPPICSREAGPEISALEPIPDRVELLGDVTTRWLKLRHIANFDKKIATFVYNFPPGPGNVGVAYFLDVAGSLRSMLETLRDAGYDTGEIDATDAEVSEKLRDMYAGYRNVGTVSAGEIRDWVHALPTDRSKRSSTTCGASRRRRSPSRGCATARCSCCCRTCRAWKTSASSMTSRRRRRRGCSRRIATPRAASAPMR